MRDATDTQLGNPCCCHPGRLEGLRHAQEARRSRERLRQLATPQGAQVRRGGTPWGCARGGKRGPGGGGICSSHLACSCIWQI